jgi:AraC-like DNA-binding protein
MNRLTQCQCEKAFQTILITKIIYSNPAYSKIESLKQKTGMDYKQLERGFLRHVGISPNYFIKIVKFNYATKLMYEHPDKTLTQIAHNAGFYDQSHFIRIFRQVSGQRPKDYFPYNSKWTADNQHTINNQFEFPSSHFV